MNSGTIDGSWKDMANWQTINITNTSLGGKLPADFAEMQELSALNLSDNKLQGPLPAGEYFVRPEHG